MSKTIKVEVPDIGDFEGVEVVEILVASGDRIGAEDSMISLESDKAAMEVPAPSAGTVGEVLVSIGDKVSQGDAILTLAVGDSEAASTASSIAPEAPAVEETAGAGVASTTIDSPSDPHDVEADIITDVAVLGSGPGGYTAAFRAADLGKRVVLIERYPTIGGVCLNVGCIPSKALLHAAQIINEADAFASHGISFGKPEIDLPGLGAWKDGVVKKMTGGLAQLAKQRKVTILQGTGRFVSPTRIEVATDDGVRVVAFERAIIAAGSEPARFPMFPWEDPRVMDSTGALQLRDVPERLLVVGGGVIGLEMATVYDALGSRVTVVELTDGLIPGCDRDLVRSLLKIIKKRYEKIYTGTRVVSVEARPDGLEVRFEGKGAPESGTFDRILVSTGRTPNGHKIGAGNAGVRVDERGFIPVDDRQLTNVGHIHAIGDIVGQPMLAHKAAHEGKVAAEVCAGMKSHFDARAIPSVAYTDPEVAWMGVTEEEAKAQGLEYEKGVYPWAASGRSLSLGRNEGLTKLLFGKDRKLIGAGIVGPNAGELIAETVLAMEMDADPEDIALTVHPHPTLSETVCFASEVVDGTVTDIYAPRKPTR